MDWDGDGWDDNQEFTEYSWGRQRFKGTLEQWRRVWYDGVKNQPDPEVRAALLDLAFFGALRVWDAGDFDEKARASEAFDEKRKGQVYQVLLGRSIYFNVGSDVFKFSRNMFAFIVAHEVYHNGLVMRGDPYGGDTEEQSANCAAYRWTGYHPGADSGLDPVEWTPG
jgi:hypothetical protein